MCLRQEKAHHHPRGVEADGLGAEMFRDTLSFFELF